MSTYLIILTCIMVVLLAALLWAIAVVSRNNDADSLRLEMTLSALADEVRYIHRIVRALDTKNKPSKKTELQRLGTDLAKTQLKLAELTVRVQKFK